MIRPMNYSRTIVFVLVLFCSLELSLVHAFAENTTKTYYGINKCKGMELIISFTYDSKGPVIENLMTIARRLDGQASITWAPKTAIEVKNDGSFLYKDKEENSITLNSKNKDLRFYTDESDQFIKGTLTPTGQASGEIGGRLKGIGDGKVDYDLCNKWLAAITGK